MRTALQIDLSFEQILSLVKRLPKKEKLKLSKELEKEVINTKLSQLLSAFRTNELDESTISAEIENIRKSIYEDKK